eukprot:bmy_22365T0
MDPDMDADMELVASQPMELPENLLRPPRRDWSKPAEAGHLFDTASKRSTPESTDTRGLRRRSDLCPLRLAAWGLARQPGPQASCSVTSRRNFRPGASPRGSAPAAPLLSRIVR